MCVLDIQEFSLDILNNICQHAQHVALFSPVLPNGMMCELGKHTERNEAQADNEHQQRDE